MTQYIGTDGLTYDYDSVAKTLVISGTGAISSLSDGEIRTAGGTKIVSDIVVATINSGVTSINQYAFSGCTALASATILDGVTTIGVGAFLVCTSLTSVTIGDSVTSIGDSVFSGCTALASITMRGTTPATIGTYVFPSITTIYVPASAVDTYKAAWPTYADQIQAAPSRRPDIVMAILTGIPIGL